jgi:hypothetical protein
VTQLIQVQLVKPETSIDDAAVTYIAAMLGLFLRPAILMLGLSNLHDLFPPVPAAGYWQCFWISAALAWLVNMGPRKTWYAR